MLFSSYSTFEYLAVVMRFAYPCLVLIIYHPPRLKNGFIGEFAELLSKITVGYDSILISGDFNIHIDTATDPLANQFTSMLSTFDLTQHTAGPTHNRGHTLDLVISKGLGVVINCILDVGISDHFCIFFDILTKHVPTSNSVRRRFLCPGILNNFITRYSARQPSNCKYNTDSSLSLCDTLVNNFNQSVTQILDDIAPYKTKTVLGKAKVPWRNTERVKTLKRACRKSECKWRKTKLQADYAYYKGLLSNYNSVIKECRQYHFSQIIANNAKNPKFLFSTIDRLVNPARPLPAELHSSEKCNEFALYFKSKVTNTRNNIISNRTGASDSHITPECHSANTLSSFTPVQSCELHKVVKQLSSATCTLDVLPTKFFKGALDCLENDVLEIVNSSLLSGTFPTTLKHALVTAPNSLSGSAGGGGGVRVEGIVYKAVWLSQLV